MPSESVCEGGKATRVPAQLCGNGRWFAVLTVVLGEDHLPGGGRVKARFRLTELVWRPGPFGCSIA